jgi:hypothetical protein
LRQAEANQKLEEWPTKIENFILAKLEANNECRFRRRCLVENRWKGPGARDRQTSAVRELSAPFKQRPKKAEAQPQ